jgi:ribosomal protein S18 acetylase RimI-like enzyme
LKITGDKVDLDAMEISIKRIFEFDKDLIAALFIRSGDSLPIDPSKDFFKDPDNILLAAFIDGTISGFLYAYVLAGLKTPDPEMFLYSIDVFPECQRRHIATQLIEELKKIAAVHGCSEIFVMTNQSNPAAIGLYQKTGGRIENGDDILFVYDLTHRGVNPG